MNYIHYSFLIISLISTTIYAKEEHTDIKFEAMPEAVRNTVSNFIKRDQISKIEKVTDDGLSKYTIKSNKTIDNNVFLEIEMTVAPDGEIMKLIKEVPVFKIPFTTMRKLNKYYPDLKIDETEIVQTRHFLLHGKQGDQPIALRIYDDGTIQEVSAKQNPPQQTSSAMPEKNSVVSDDENQQPLPENNEEYSDDYFRNEVRPLIEDK